MNGIHGKYYQPELSWTYTFQYPKMTDVKPYARDEAEAKKLWEYSEMAVAKVMNTKQELEGM